LRRPAASRRLGMRPIASAKRMQNDECRMQNEDLRGEFVVRSVLIILNPDLFRIRGIGRARHGDHTRNERKDGVEGDTCVEGSYSPAQVGRRMTASGETRGEG